MPTLTLNVRLLILLLALTMRGQAQSVPSSVPESPDEQSTQSLLSSLAKAQHLISVGRIPDALEVLKNLATAASALQRDNLRLKEEVLWQSAMAHLDFAQQLINQDQRNHYAARARDHWLQYIQWFDTLSDGEKANLPSGNMRINQAVRFLGNSLVVMRDQRRLLHEYMNIPRPQYLGVDAIELWKDILYSCPDWSESRPRTASLRRAKICSQECKEDWIAYGAALKDWAKEYNLRNVARERYLREAEQIQQESARCSSQ